MNSLSSSVNSVFSVAKYKPLRQSAKDPQGKLGASFQAGRCVKFVRCGKSAKFLPHNLAIRAPPNQYELNTRRFSRAEAIR